MPRRVCGTTQQRSAAGTVSTRSPSHPKTPLSRQTARMSYYYVNQAPLKRGDYRAEGVGFEPTRTHSLVLRPLKAAAIGY